MLTKKDLMKLESLLYLLSFSKSGSKRNVAESLGISTDTMNKYISDLEESLGFKLINSNNRGSVLTPQAKEILPLADTLKSIIREIEFIAQSNTEVSGTVRIAIQHGCATPLYKADMQDFYRKYPGIKLDVAISNFSETDNIHDEDFDVIISFVEPTGGDKVIIETKNAVCGFFTSEEYLKEYGMPYDLNDLLNNHRLCLNEQNAKYIEGLKGLVKDMKHIVYMSSSTFSTYIMACRGVGIAVFPLAYDTGNLMNISGIIDNEMVSMNCKMYLIANRNTKDVPKIRAVLDYLKQEIRKMP